MISNIHRKKQLNIEVYDNLKCQLSRQVWDHVWDEVWDEVSDGAKDLIG